MYIGPHDGGDVCMLAPDREEHYHDEQFGRGSPTLGPDGRGVQIYLMEAVRNNGILVYYRVKRRSET